MGIQCAPACFPQRGLIGIGTAVTRRPLPHDRAYGSEHGGSSRLPENLRTDVAANPFC
jgi:hypothetical protein